MISLDCVRHIHQNPTTSKPCMDSMLHVKVDETRGIKRGVILLELECSPTFKRSARPVCAGRSTNGSMLPSEQILEAAARDGSIDM
jgi:hypothetical protein